jgi:hypothetical protein
MFCSKAALALGAVFKRMVKTEFGFFGLGASAGF